MLVFQRMAGRRNHKTGTFERPEPLPAALSARKRGNGRGKRRPAGARAWALPTASSPAAQRLTALASARFCP